jgi:hypothetical protein
MAAGNLQQLKVYVPIEVELPDPQDGWPTAAEWIMAVALGLLTAYVLIF